MPSRYPTASRAAARVPSYERVCDQAATIARESNIATVTFPMVWIGADITCIPGDCEARLLEHYGSVPEAEALSKDAAERLAVEERQPVLFGCVSVTQDVMPVVHITGHFDPPPSQRSRRYPAAPWPCPKCGSRTRIPVVARGPNAGDLLEGPHAYDKAEAWACKHCGYGGLDGPQRS